MYLAALPLSPLAHDCGSGAHGQPAPWEVDGGTGPAGVGAVEAEALRRHTAEAMRAHVRARGTLPGGWKRWADEVLEPTVDWRQALAGAVREAAAWASGAVDYTYRGRPAGARPCAAWCCPACGGRCPGWRSSSTPRGRWARPEIGAALAEVTGVLREVGIRGNRVTVLACDADVQAVARVTSAGQITLERGGGTDMRVPVRMLSPAANGEGHVRRRAAGSRSATCRATESTPGRAYRSRERTEAWRERASSIGVEVPSSASCVRAL